MKQHRTLFLAQPHGICAGVRRALDAVEAVLRRTAPPVYVFHEIVHNNFLVEQFKQRGVRFVENIDEVPPGSVLLLSAHGVPRAIEQRAAERQLTLVDATCPLVKRLHTAAAKAGETGETLILFGHRNHPETIGIVGRTDGKHVFVLESPDEIAALPPLPPEHPIRLLTQTTLNVEEVEAFTARLRERFPALKTGPGVCYATTNRQRATRQLAAVTKRILVIGSPRSSNSNRLREIAAQEGAQAFLIDGPEELPAAELAAAENVGVTAGASAPEALVRQILSHLAELGFNQVTMIGETREEVNFNPPEIRL